MGVVEQPATIQCAIFVHEKMRKLNGRRNCRYIVIEADSQ